MFFSKIRRFIRRFQVGQRLDLSYIFAHAKPEAPLADRVEWAASLVEWIRSPHETQTNPTTRLRFVMQLLERQPQWKQKSAAVLRSILRETRHVRLYSEVGLPTRPTFNGEFRRRLTNVFMPAYEDPQNLAGTQARIFNEEGDHEWFSNLPEDLLKEVLTWLRTGLAPDEPLIPGWQNQVLDAIRILTARSLAITMREDIELRSPEFSISNHPLGLLHDRLGDLRTKIANGSASREDFDELRKLSGEGRKIIQAVRSHLEQFGVSVDLVYQMDRLRNDLFRLNRLLALLEGDQLGKNLVPLVHGISWELLRGSETDTDFGAILRKHIGILSRKIVERTGHTGEHYITHTRKEYFHMLVMAGGGGALTAITAFLKYLPPTENWPLFLEFLYHGTNYAGCFLLMHILGFKLATKQPSMTAAALAGRLKEDGSEDADAGFVDEIARISRSQFAAVMGNILAVIPVALLIDYLWKTQSGHSYFSPEKSTYFLDSINPLFSATIFYGALTGVLLWLSSMTAGWVENASVYLRIPDYMRTHPLIRWAFGEKRAERLAQGYLKNVSGVVGSIALGFFLAGTPMIGKFFGIPLNAHHVTLSTGAATYSMSALGWGAITGAMIAWTAVGILLIAALNFGVSFLLALSIALRARDLSPKRVRSIFKQAGRRLLRSPGEFLFPVKNKRRESSDPSGNR
ncbi:MAG: hypothetical protein KF789_08150 [Bdellovibrionaceae bacterium]|nr:hypothetical protein [Pseudobdellovibrionaceae bacterium]